MLRYYGNIRTSLGRLIRLEIHNSAYGGAAEELVISADSLTIDQNREGRFGAICSAGWTIVVESDTDFKFQPMLLDGDLDNSCRIYENGELLFSGWLENGVAEQEYVAPPYDVQLAFNDGLKKLKGYYLNPTGMWDKGYYNFIELFRICLSPIMQANKQGKKMLYINNSLYNDAFKQDLAWSCFEQIYLHASAFDGDKILLYDLLENLLKPATCYIAQVDGDWYIERVKNKIHSGSVDYHAFDLTTAYDIVNNRGVIKHVDGLNYGLGYNMHEFNGSPTLTTEKEYGLLNINVDNTLRDSIISSRYNTAKGIDLLSKRIERASGGSVSYLLPSLGWEIDSRSAYAWYYTKSIDNKSNISFTPITSKYGITKGMEMTHSSGNDYMYHMFSKSYCHVNTNGRVRITFKVYVDIKQDTISAKTYVVIPIELMGYLYVNNTDWPNGGKIPNYVSTVLDFADRYRGVSQGSGPGCVCFFLNSEANKDEFEKWYNGYAVELTAEFSYWPEGQKDTPAISLFPALFCDGKYLPTCANDKIVKTTYGDIRLEVLNAENLEDGYSLDKTTAGEYVAKREAPSVDLKYWEGPPILEKDYSTSPITTRTFVNFAYKNLIYVPAFLDVVRLDSLGNVVGIKVVDGDQMDIKISNSLNFKWYDRCRQLDDYNKKGFLIEHVTQDVFDSYSTASGVFKGIMHTGKRPRMIDTYLFKHLPGRYFIASSIKQMVDADEYELILEEIKDRKVVTELFLPRVVSSVISK